MSQEDESAKLFDTVDTFADQQLQELHLQLEQARDTIDETARTIAAQLRGEASTPGSSLRPTVQPKIAAASTEPPALAPKPSVESTRVAQKLSLQNAPDFGDIAATIATDAEWKKR